MNSIVFGLSPILAVALGALLLMLAEAFGKPDPAAIAAGASPLDAGAGRSSELALGAAIVLFAGAICSMAVWLVGPENLPGLEKLAPYLLVDRFSLFFEFVLCVGAGLAAVVPMIEHSASRIRDVERRKWRIMYLERLVETHEPL